MELTNNEWAWLAGLLEGEGSFPISKRGYPRIALTMCDRDVVDRVGEWFGYAVREKEDSRPNVKNQFYVNITKARTLNWIALHIYKYLGERRRAQIDKWYDIWESKGYDFDRPKC